MTSRTPLLQHRGNITVAAFLATPAQPASMTRRSCRITRGLRGPGDGERFRFSWVRAACCIWVSAGCFADDSECMGKCIAASLCVGLMARWPARVRQSAPRLRGFGPGPRRWAVAELLARAGQMDSRPRALLNVRCAARDQGHHREHIRSGHARLLQDHRRTATIEGSGRRVAFVTRSAILRRRFSLLPAKGGGKRSGTPRASSAPHAASSDARPKVVANAAGSAIPARSPNATIAPAMPVPSERHRAPR